ncbi:MAG: T9SS type A sorting domain-containing protein [Bacteroidales bacterium]|nr:T9SS type A sorting domain-containing protein [Bacteroidales bacterium]
MRKLALLFVMAVFVSGLSAQNFTPVKSLKENPKSNAIGLMPQTPPMKKAYESVGWLNPLAYLQYLLPSSYEINSKRTSMEIFPDSCVNFVWDKPEGLDEFSIWRHAIGSSFDPYSESFDKVFQAGIFPTPDSPAVVTYPYTIDTVMLYGLYHWGAKDGYKASSPDTLRLFFTYYKVYERIGIQKEWYALHYTSDVHQDTAMFSPIITFDAEKMKLSKNGLLKPVAANTITVDYILQAGDTNRYWDSVIEGQTHQYYSYRGYKIPVNLTNGFEVPAGAIVSCIVNFVPGYQYSLGDTLVFGKVNADNTIDGGLHYNHNTFSLMVYNESNNAKAFCDPYGYNASFFDHKYTHYQMWKSGDKPNTLYNSMYYPTHALVPFIQYHFAYDSLGAVEVADSSKFRKVGISEASDIIESIYPNPTRDFVTVTLKNDMPATIRIVNVMGQVIKTVCTNEERNIISTKDLSAGIYFLSVEQKGRRYSTKLTVQ